MTATAPGAPQVLLAHHLKALKLPTFLREHDKLARQCASDGVDQPGLRISLDLLAVERDGRFAGPDGIGDEAGEDMDHGVPDGAVA
jgi:hypothetical protein